MTLAENKKPHIPRRQAKGCGAYGQPGGAVGAIIPRLSPGAQGGTSK